MWDLGQHHWPLAQAATVPAAKSSSSSAWEDSREARVETQSLGTRVSICTVCVSVCAYGCAGDYLWLWGKAHFSCSLSPSAAYQPGGPQPRGPRGILCCSQQGQQGDLAPRAPVLAGASKRA